MYQRDDASSNAKHETLATPEEEEEEEEKGKKRKRYREGFDTSWLDPQTWNPPSRFEFENHWGIIFGGRKAV